MDRANRVNTLVGTAFDYTDDGPGALGIEGAEREV